MLPFKYFVIAFVVFFIAWTEAAPNEVVKNAAGVVVFEVIEDGRSVQVPNHHRAQSPALKFSIHGCIVLRLEPKPNTKDVWLLHLNDGSLVEFSAVEKSAGKVTEFVWLWHGGGPNNERDVCFNYAFNNASW